PPLPPLRHTLCPDTTLFRSPYSQAVGFGNLLFLSGQIAIDPETNVLLQGTVEEQTKLAMENMSAVLEAANLSLDNVLKITLYLANMNDFSLVNDIYKEYFPENPPARSTVEVSRLPRNVLVEIDAIAAFPTDV
ncbi:MAG: Rid family detoxifying hydrolase, partial [Myxococcota bacterium]